MQVMQLPIFGTKCNGNPSSETNQPLATSSLAVGHFAAKQGSLRSPRGQVVASLKTSLKNGFTPEEYGFTPDYTEEFHES